MSILRVYKMTAMAGRASDLLGALQTLAARLSSLDGNEGIELLANLDDPQNYMLIERWRSAESQQTAGALLGKEVFAGIAPLLSGRPEAASLQPVGAWKTGGE